VGGTRCRVRGSFPHEGFRCSAHSDYATQQSETTGCSLLAANEGRLGVVARLQTLYERFEPIRIAIQLHLLRNRQAASAACSELAPDRWHQRLKPCLVLARGTAEVGVAFLVGEFGSKTLRYPAAGYSCASTR
jgi:hypothetical protein